MVAHTSRHIYMYLLCDLTTESENIMTVKNFIFIPFFPSARKKIAKQTTKM
jgi:hypothetical protein